MRRFTLLALAVCLVAPAVALAATATTGPAENVTQSAATLTATVDPQGTATPVHFEYGTSSSYGLTTGDQTASGTGAQTVKIPVSGLTSATTYHYRVVAGAATGADRTFRTSSPPSAPQVVTGGVRDVTPGGATLTGSVDANSQPTKYHFEYGRTGSLGTSTPEQDIGRGPSAVPVSAAISGFPANTRVYYRVVATSPPGTRRGATRSFVTRRAVTGATITLSATTVLYGDGLAITGKLTGSGVNGVPMILEYKPFPFSAAFRQVGPVVNSARNGSYRFTLPTLLLTARLRVSTRGGVFSSREAVVHSAPRVGLIAARGRRVRFRGSVRPALPNGTASLQRVSASGHWVTVRRVKLRRSGVRSRYSLSVRARRGDARYRVKVAPHDGGAHSSGYSRERLVAGRR